MNTRLSVCMIVRNEAHLLARCLDSVTPLADEVCIVDTGSTDDTRALALRLGARVRTFEACNFPDGSIRDFSLARNVALDMATGDWVLSIDADEVLTEGSAEALARAISSTQAAGISLTVQDGERSWRTARVFRRQGSHRFTGRIHEYVPIDGISLDAPQVTLLHLPDKRNREASHERNLRMCEAEARERPDDPRALYYLAQELKTAGRYDEAILRYTEQLALNCGWPTERFQAALGIASCLLRKGDVEAAVQAGLRALHIDPRYAEAHCVLGDSYFIARNIEFASHWYRSALACGAPPADSPTPVLNAAYGQYPRRRLEECSVLVDAQNGVGAPSVQAVPS